MSEEEEIPSLADLQKLRVVDLKKELQRLGLSQSGNKADLVQRIHEHYQAQEGGAEGGEDIQEEGDAEEVEGDESPEPEGEGGEQEEEEQVENILEQVDEESQPAPAVEEPEPEQEEPAQIEEQPVEQEVEQPQEIEQEPETVEEQSPEDTEQPLEEQEQPQEEELIEQPQEEEKIEQPHEEELIEQPQEETPTEQIEEQAQQEQCEPEVEEEAPQPKLSVQLGSFKSHPAGAPDTQESELEQQEDQDEYGGGDQETQEQEEEMEQESHEETPPPAEQTLPEPSEPALTAYQQQDQYDPTEEMDDEEDIDNDQEEEEKENKPDKKGRKSKKKKKKKKNRPEKWAMEAITAHRRKMNEERSKTEPEVEVEYIQEELALEPTDPLFRSFNKIFQAFKIVEEPKEEKEAKKEEEVKAQEEEFKKVPKLLEDEDFIDKPDDDGENKMSKRKLKKLSRLSVAELKQLVTRPDVVEMHDVTARDPRLLVHLKSTRNTVPVPRHWCFKRKYLQGKRGIEKPPFDLPEFIKKTGIMEMREALQEKEDAKGMKAKQREKVRPKLGKIDIDYQKLHDAFFKWQTKPRMTLHGDLYYEGKEFEIRLKEKKPGDLTDDLRTALGMPVGPNAHKVPPPWLIAMQRYGPPPSYPNLKICGLNAPIPDGCSFGYHAGGWGKPPVDEAGKPLYGDVFGTSDQKNFPTQAVEEIDQTLWGELESESEDESESSEEEEDDEDDGEATGLQTPVVDPGLATPSGTTSVGGAGLETPDMIELRKRRIEADMEGGETPSLPYTVIPERQNARVGASMMGSTHTYDIKGAAAAKGKTGREAAVEMALNPEEIDEMDSEAMALRAEAALREQQANLAKEDLSDMVAEHAAKQRNKRKRQEQKDEKDKSKKYKEFKF